MKKHFLIPLLLCLFAALPGRSQLATMIDTTLNRGILFSDGTTLYEIHTDTLSSVNTTTGGRTMLHKLPAFRPSNTTGTPGAHWGTQYNIKTATGFILSCSYDVTNSYPITKIWSYDGNSWDTAFLAPYFDWFSLSNSPVQVGSNNFYMFRKFSGPAGDTTVVTVVKTDGTMAGTQVMSQANYPSRSLKLAYAMYPNSTPPLFTIDHLDGYSTTTTTHKYKLGVADNSGVRIIDSSSYSVLPMGLNGSDLVYAKGLTPYPNTTYDINKYNLTTQIKSNLMSATTNRYEMGVGFKGKIVVPKTPSPYTTALTSLVSFDPATNMETVLMDSLVARTNGYSVSGTAVGTDHLFIPVGSYGASMYSNVTRTMLLTDGITPTNNSAIYRTYSGSTFGFGLQRNMGVESGYGTLVNDTIYCALWYGTNFERLYRITGAKVVDSQFSCIKPSNFVKVSGQVYFKSYNSTTTQRNGLWKIGATTPTAVNALPEKSLQAFLYPNPARTSITVTLPNTVATATLQLYDASGRQVLFQKVQSQQSLSTVQLPNGLYIYQVTAPDGTLLAADRLSIVH